MIDTVETAYSINGYKYRFKKLYFEGGLRRGYSPRRKKWATLYPDCVHFDGEPPIEAYPCTVKLAK